MDAAVCEFNGATAPNRVLVQPPATSLFRSLGWANVQQQQQQCLDLLPPRSEDGRAFFLPLFLSRIDDLDYSSLIWHVVLAPGRCVSSECLPA